MRTMQGTHLLSLRSGLSGSCRPIRTLLLLTLFVSVASRAFGQEYFTLPIDEKAKNDRNVAMQCLKDPAVFAAQKAKFENYFQNYYFPAMTRTEPDKLGDLPSSGKTFSNELYGRRRTRQRNKN